MTLNVVLVNDEGPAADTKPSEMITLEAAPSQVKSATSALTAGKALKSIKTMFYVGTEVSLLLLCAKHTYYECINDIKLYFLEIS